MLMQTLASHSVAVIPVHNEASTIAAIVRATHTYVPVIVVDDASDDGSGQRAAAAGATVLTLPRHHGKGVALRHGFAAALRCGAQHVITLDGDGQHDPHDIPRFLTASCRWRGSIIIGNRLAVSTEIPRQRLQAIQVSSFWINWMAECHIQDTQSGFRLYPAAMLQSLSLKRGGFLLESEILLKAGQAGYGMREIPIRPIYRRGQRSHYRPCRDGVLAAAYLCYRGLRFWPRQISRLFSPGCPAVAGEKEQAWQHTRVAARATILLPTLFLVMLAQLCLRDAMGDMLTPMIRRFYDQRSLSRSVAIVRRALHDRSQWKRWEFI
jgi:glycosyltransferase involved in cell wall biosynthesis